jgi:peptidyl-prolyl cis-trans isomerase SurA
MNGFASTDRADEDGRLTPPPRRIARGVWLLLILMALAARAEVIDRIAITVGSRVITESDILREVRLAAFFNQAEADLSPLAKRQAAGRLVERALIEMEMEAGQYEFPDVSEATPALETMKKDRSPNAGAWPGALSKYRLVEEDVRRRLLEQLALESFIDERFGPAVQVSDDEMREYYAKRFVPAWEAGPKGAAPPFEEVRGEIGQILRAQRADELLNNWLKESRGRIRIEFKDETLR